MLADCSREEAKRLLCQANMKPPLLAKPLWADGREGAHGLAVIHEVRLHHCLLCTSSSIIEACGIPLTTSGSSRPASGRCRGYQRVKIYALLCRWKGWSS